MSDDPITGACLCGAVRFEIAREALGQAGYCHCTRCQRRTGTAASAQVSVEAGAIRITQGADNVTAYQPEDGYAKLFCSACGGALFSRAPDAREPTSVRLGTLDGDHGIRPSYRQFLDSAAPWEPVPDDGLTRYPGPRPGR